MSDPFWLGVSTGVGVIAGAVVIINVLTVAREWPFNNSETDSALAIQAAGMSVVAAIAAVAGAVFA